MSGAAASVHFSCRYSGEADMRPFGAPDRPVAVPHGRWRAVEGLAGGHDGDEKNGKDHRYLVTMMGSAVNTLTIWPGAIVADLPVMIAEPSSAPAVLPRPSCRWTPRSL